MRLKYMFETMELDNQFVAVPIDTGAKEFHGVVRMNDTAIRIFELLKEEITQDQIIETMISEYDVPRETLLEDVEKTLADFSAKGLLTE